MINGNHQEPQFNIKQDKPLPLDSRKFVISESLESKLSTFIDLALPLLVRIANGVERASGNQQIDPTVIKIRGECKTQFLKNTTYIRDAIARFIEAAKFINRKEFSSHELSAWLRANNFTPDKEKPIENISRLLKVIGADLGIKRLEGVKTKTWIIQ